MYAFRVKNRQDRILQNTHRLLGSCWEEPGHFRDPDWNGASVSVCTWGLRFSGLREQNGAFGPCLLGKLLEVDVPQRFRHPFQFLFFVL